jgi:hypothetical protein
MDEQPTSKSGCIWKGCLIAALGSVAVAGMGLAALFYLYVVVVDRLTSAQPQNLTLAAPSPGQYQTAKLALERFRSAVAANREETIEFTADDLNALIAQHPDFRGARGRARLGIADSAATLDLNVPIGAVAMPRLKGRWCNGSIRFTLDYEFDQFKIEPSLIRMGGWRVPGWLLSTSFSSSFSQSFSNGYRQTLQKDPRGAAFWKHIKKMTLDHDKLVVITQRAD